MSKNNFKFIKVDPNYINFLLKYDNKVSYNEILLKKENRPFLGILLNINSKKYYAPLSSKKNKFIKLHKIYKRTNKNNIDLFFIEDKKGKLLSVLNLNNMIPIAVNSIIEFDIRKDRNANLLEKEIEFCNSYRNKKEIKKRAIKIYNIVRNHTNKNVEERCCNFKLLEEKCEEYEGKNIINV